MVGFPYAVEGRMKRHSNLNIKIPGYDLMCVELDMESGIYQIGVVIPLQDKYCYIGKPNICLKNLKVLSSRKYIISVIFYSLKTIS